MEPTDIGYCCSKHGWLYLGEKERAAGEDVPKVQMASVQIVPSIYISSHANTGSHFW